MSTNTHRHTHTDRAKPVQVNCYVLESLGRHQRAQAASYTELKISNQLDVNAWPSRLDQSLIHSLGPRNYGVSTEPHATASNTHAQTCSGTLKMGHRNTQDVSRPSWHERCSRLYCCVYLGKCVFIYDKLQFTKWWKWFLFLILYWLSRPLLNPNKFKDLWVFILSLTSSIRRIQSYLPKNEHHTKWIKSKLTNPKHQQAELNTDISRTQEAKTHNVGMR